MLYCEACRPQWAITVDNPVRGCNFEHATQVWNLIGITRGKPRPRRRETTTLPRRSITNSVLVQKIAPTLFHRILRRHTCTGMQVHRSDSTSQEF